MSARGDFSSGNQLLPRRWQPAGFAPARRCLYFRGHAARLVNAAAENNVANQFKIGRFGIDTTACRILQVVIDPAARALGNHIGEAGRFQFQSLRGIVHPFDEVAVSLRDLIKLPDRVIDFIDPAKNPSVSFVSLFLCHDTSHRPLLQKFMHGWKKRIARAIGHLCPQVGKSNDMANENFAIPFTGAAVTTASDPSQTIINFSPTCLVATPSSLAWGHGHVIALDRFFPKIRQSRRHNFARYGIN